MPRIEFSSEFGNRLTLHNTKPTVIANKISRATTRQAEVLQNILFTIQMVNYILSKKKFKFAEGPETLGRNWLKQASFQKLFFSAFQFFNEIDLKALFPRYKYHPYFELFLKLKDKINPETGGRLLRLTGAKKYDNENRALEAIRNISKQDKFRESLDAFRRGPNENSGKLRRFFTQCLRVEDTLNFVRLDLYSQAEELQPSFNARIAPQVIKGNFKKLLDHIKKKLLKNTFVGYAWKLNYSANSSAHYQLLIFCLPVSREVDSSIPDLVGRQWLHITMGVGIYYRHQGISFTATPYEAGCLNWKTNIDARARLRKLGNEVFVNDYYINPNLGKHFKSFGISEVIDPRESAIERRKRKALLKEREKKQLQLSDFKSPMPLRRLSSSKKPKTAAS